MFSCALPAGSGEECCRCQESFPSCGSGYEPTPLADFEIESLRSGLHLRKFEPHPYLVVGERVRIKAGPLEGMEGVLLRKKNNLRVVLTVASIKQSVAVEVDAGDVEPLSVRQATRGASAYELSQQ